MDLVPILAAYGTATLIVIILAAGILAARGYGGSALVEQVLRRQGDAVAARSLAAGRRDLAVAVQRCVSCNQAAQCRAWLASGAREGYETFCPNARYVRRMKELAA